jgi:hypothetical protein
MEIADFPNRGTWKDAPTNGQSFIPQGFSYSLFEMELIFLRVGLGQSFKEEKPQDAFGTYPGRIVKTT